MYFTILFLQMMNLNTTSVIDNVVSIYSLSGIRRKYQCIINIQEQGYKKFWRQKLNKCIVV